MKQGGPSVRGTIKLTGALGTTGSTPTDFTVNQALDAPPAVKLESLQCGEAFITTPSTSDNALFLYAKACGSSTSTTLTFYVPLEVGSYPTKNPKFPIVSAALGPRFSATEVQYGSSKKAAAGTLTISDVSGVAKTTTPWTVEHLKVTYVGSLPKSVDCTGPSCANGGPTLDVDLNLELSKVSTK